MTRIINEAKPITAISWEDGSVVKVGLSGVDQIKPYEENGEMAKVTWFLVRHIDDREIRYNAKYVAAVSYK